MNGFGWSKTPLKLLIILFLAGSINFGLILGLQMVFSYRTSGSMNEAKLAQLDDIWQDCKILDQRQISGSNFYICLVEKADGSLHLVTLQKHYLLNRYRLMPKACQSLSQTGETVNLKAGITQLYLSVEENNQTGALYIHPEGTGIINPPGRQFRNQMIFGITGLCILELTVWCLVFRKEEIA